MNVSKYLKFLNYCTFVPLFPLDLDISRNFVQVAAPYLFFYVFVFNSGLQTRKLGQTP